MKRYLLNFLISFIVYIANIAIGYFTSWHISGSQAFLTGLLVFFILELIFIRIKVDKLLKQHELLVPLVTNFKLENKFSEIIVLYALRSF